MTKFSINDKVRYLSIYWEDRSLYNVNNYTIDDRGRVTYSLSNGKESFHEFEEYLQKENDDGGF